MADVDVHPADGLTTRGRPALIGIPIGDSSEEVVRYFTSEEDADHALATDDSTVRLALSAIGSWADQDFDEMLNVLDRIRHQSTPTPPLDLDV
jgi:hypothetical protein